MAKKKQDNEKALLRQAYGQATQDLREAHREDFNKFYAARAEALGVSWAPRPSAEEKAEATFDQLLVEYPHLRDRVTSA